MLIISSTAAFTMMPGMAAYAASKAGVEQFANCLRLEVAHKGVKVGSVHPGWIDTDLVRDQRKDLKTFDEAFDRFPWPMNATTSVEDCADAIVDGIERRRAARLRAAGDRPRAGAAHAHHRPVGDLADRPRGEDDGARRWRPRCTALGALLRQLERGDARSPPADGAAQSSPPDATARGPPRRGHRARLTGGLAAAIAEKGYAAVTIADVVRHARVSKRTFYEHFADKEACFLALYAETSDELHRR